MLPQTVKHHLLGEPWAYMKDSKKIPNIACLWEIFLITASTCLQPPTTSPAEQINPYVTTATFWQSSKTPDMFPPLKDQLFAEMWGFFF